MVTTSLYTNLAKDELKYYPEGVWEAHEEFYNVTEICPFLTGIKDYLTLQENSFQLSPNQ